MRLKSIFALLFVVLLTVSCKKEEKTNTEEKQVLPAQERFTVVISMIAKEDDIMTLYYKDNTMENYVEDVSIYKEVKKGDQEIVIALPEGYLPNGLRFDLSTRVPSQVCKIEKIHVSNQGQSFDILNKDLEKYLTPNEGVVFDTKDRSYSFKEFEGNYDPIIYATPEFYALLAPLVGKEAFDQPAVK